MQSLGKIPKNVFVVIIESCNSLESFTIKTYLKTNTGLDLSILRHLPFVFVGASFKLLNVMEKEKDRERE